MQSVKQQCIEPVYYFTKTSNNLSNVRETLLQQSYTHFVLLYELQL